jgi:hypothetical protein
LKKGFYPQMAQITQMGRDNARSLWLMMAFVHLRPLRINVSG